MKISFNKSDQPKLPEGASEAGFAWHIEYLDQWTIKELQTELKVQQNDIAFPENGEAFRLNLIERLEKELKSRMQ